jgi:hypothetical protein
MTICQYHDSVDLTAWFQQLPLQNTLATISYITTIITGSSDTNKVDEFEPSESALDMPAIC